MKMCSFHTMLTWKAHQGSWISLISWVGNFFVLYSSLWLLSDIFSLWVNGSIVAWLLDSSLCHVFKSQPIDRLPSGINCHNVTQGNRPLPVCVSWLATFTKILDLWGKSSNSGGFPPNILCFGYEYVALFILIHLSKLMI